MPTYIEYTLENGNKLLVEIDEPESGIVKAARRDGNLVVESGKKFKDALAGIRDSASALLEELDVLKVDEAEVKFGLKATGEAGVLAVGKVGGEINYEVTLKWKNPTSARSSK